MRRSILIIVGIILTSVAFVQPYHAFAAVNENFDSYATDTLAEDLTISGASFSGGGNWFIMQANEAAPPFAYITGQNLVGIEGTPLTITFTQPQGSYDFLFAISNIGNPDSLTLEGFLNGAPVFTDTVLGTPPNGNNWPEGNATGSGIAYDQLVIYHPVEAVAIDNLVTTDYVGPIPTPDPIPVTSGINVPQVTQIQINVSAPVTPYDSPAGTPVRLADGSTFDLPQDYDLNGFDTYIVTASVDVDGVTWVSIFLGNTDFVWVQLDQVQLIGPTP